MKLVLAILVVSGVLIGCYLFYILMTAYGKVKTMPRQDMFICQKGHGPIAKQHLINFMGEDFCPQCFHERLKKAEKEGL